MKRRRRAVDYDPICHFGCNASVKGSPFLSPMVEVVGAFWKVCSPGCPARPVGVIVFDKGADR